MSAKRGFDRLSPSIIRSLLKNGGTVGQVLVKTSDTDYGWGNPGGIINGFQGQAYAVWSGVGLVFNVFWPIYFINGRSWPAGSGSVTLSPADPTNDRLDIIALNAAGCLSITGTPSSDPVKPTIDSLTQLEVTTILVSAGATEPVEITDENVYKENIEWVGSSDIAGISFSNTSSPFSGTKCIDVGSFTSGKYIRFIDSSSPITHDISQYGFVKFYIKLKAPFTTTTGFIITFKNGSAIISSQVTVTNGLFNFDCNNTSGYQLIAIPLSQFTFYSANFDTLNIQLKGSNASGFKLDNIVIQAGISTVTSTPSITSIITDSGTLLVDRANDVIQMRGAGGASISASGKVITITAESDIIASDKQLIFSDGTNNPTGASALYYDKTTKVLGLDSIDFAITPTAPSAERRLMYDNGEGTLVYTLRGGNITTPLNGALLSLVNNGESTTLNKGEIVYAFSAQGQRVQVKRASNSAESTSSKTFGIVAESIAAGAEGFVMVHGIVKGINTSAYAAGTPLYLSSTSGTFTDVKPSAPSHLVYVGFVVKSHATSGEIFARIQNGYELDELHDVALAGLANNDFLVYESSSSLWKNKTKSALGIGSVTSVAALTLGTAGTDLSSSVANGTTTPVITLNVPTASATNRGVLSSSDWTTFNNKQGAITLTTTGSSGSATFVANTLNIPNYTLAGLGGLSNPMTTLGDIIYGGSSGVATRLAGSVGFLKSTGAAAPVWSSILGSDITGEALTKTDDTNVTLTLGGTPASSLLRATSLTLGWTGTLAVGRGGLGVNTITGVIIGNGTSAVSGVTGTANQILRRNAGNTAYEFFTPTYLTANQSITLSGEASGTGSTAITVSLDNASVIGKVLTGLSVLTSTAVVATDSILIAIGKLQAQNTAQDTSISGKQAQLNGTGFVKASGTTISYDNSTYLTANQSITLSGDVSGTGSTSIATTIGANKVTLAMMAQVATSTILGRVSALTGNVEALTGTQATTLLDVFTSTLKGLAPASGGGTTNFLRADGTWAAPSFSGVSSITFGTTGLTPSTATSGAITVAGTLVAANGGTGQSSYTIGDILYASTTTALSKLASVAAGSFLRSAGVGTAPSWSTIIIPNSAALGDLWYGSASNTVSSLSGNTTATKQFLSQTGNGTISAAPTWSAIAGSDITGAALTKTDDTNVTLTLGGTPATSLLRAASITVGWTGQLAVSRGGTGAGTLTGAVIGSGTSALTAIVGTAGQLMRRNLADTAYEFFTFSGLTNPMTTIGDIIYGGASGVATRLAAGTSGQALVSAGVAAPVWTTLTLENLPGAFVKRSVRVATTGSNITLSAGAPNTLDGITLAANDRILVKDQTAPAQNGIYIVQTLGTGANGTWVRSADADTADEIASAMVAVDSGTINGGFTFDNDFKTTDTLGTTSMTWNRIIDTGYTIPVSQGGTGATTLTGIVVASGTTAMTAVAGTANQLLRRNAGNTAYEFFTPTYISAAITSLNGLTAATQTFTNDTNVTITSTTSAHAIGWSGQLSVARGGTGAATLTGVVIGAGTSALTAIASTTALQVFRVNSAGTGYEFATLTTLTNPMTTLGDMIYGAASGVATRFAGNTTTAKQYLSQTGTGTASAVPVWSAIAGADVTGAALTKTDDTNVTLTLGGTPATSLLRAASLTLGWTGTLAISRGGTGLSTLGTANQLLRVNAGATALEYFTPAFASAGVSTEVQTSNGSGGFTTSGIFGTLGSLTLGSTSIAATKSISVEGTTADVNLTIIAKGAGDIVLGNISTNGLITRTASAIRVLVTTASTNAVIPAIDLTSESTGTPAIGIGTSLRFIAETSTSNNEIGATIEAITTNVTATTEAFDLVFKTMSGGAAAAERLRISSTGNVGIGTTPTTSRLTIVGDTTIFNSGATMQADILVSTAQTLRIRNYHASGADITFETNPSAGSNTERLRITSTGNVGIGTTTINDRLVIAGALDANTRGANLIQSYMALGETGGGASTILGNNIKASGTVGSSVIHFVTTDQGQFIKLNYLAGITFHTNITSTVGTSITETTNERVRIDNSGNMGIGTSSPSSRLHVFNTGATVSSTISTDTNNEVNFRLLRTGVTSPTDWQWYLPASSTDIRLYLGGTGDIMTVNTSGNLGIGTITPTSAKVEINAANAALMVRQSSSTGYTGMRWLNDIASTARALEIDYSGSAYGTSLLSSGVTGEAASIATTGAYPLMLGTTNTARLIIAAGGNIMVGTTTDAGFKLDVNGTVRTQGDLTISDAKNIILAATTGTKIGTATTQKLAFWNKTPIVQPTTAIAASGRIGGAGTNITTLDTFAGYTIQQVINALITVGILA